MFCITRYTYPNTNLCEAMDYTFKEFDTIEKAIKYAHRYAKGNKFAGVIIESDGGTLLYEITAKLEVFDYRNSR